MKNIKTQKGITLIALVITIIVMLILVGVTISMALNGGLFGYAKKAAKDTESQKQAEQELANGAVIVDGVKYDSMQDYMDGIPTGTPKPIDKVEKDENGILKENARYVSDGKTAVIPKGFTIVADENGEKLIDKGLIITDEVDSTGKSIGNEYVWVPVENGELNRTEWSNNEPTGTRDSKYTEKLPDDLVNSVKINKGFYIGRYEAGSEKVRTGKTADTLTKVLTKRGLYPYNYVSQTNAVDQTAKMYTDKTKYGVVAILPYGAMWDETLRFVKDNAHNVTRSTTWGNYKNATFKVTGKYSIDAGENWTNQVTNQTKPENTGWLLTTGASEENKAKNIYDLAGNVGEWTQESYSTSSRVTRGGSYNDYGYAAPASSHGYNRIPQSSEYSIGFRPALYIK